MSTNFCLQAKKSYQNKLGDGFLQKYYCNFVFEEAFDTMRESADTIGNENVNLELISDNDNLHGYCKNNPTSENVIQRISALTLTTVLAGNKTSYWFRLSKGVKH